MTLEYECWLLYDLCCCIGGGLELAAAIFGYLFFWTQIPRSCGVLDKGQQFRSLPEIRRDR